MFKCKVHNFNTYSPADYRLHLEKYHGIAKDYGTHIESNGDEFGTSVLLSGAVSEEVEEPIVEEVEETVSDEGGDFGGAGADGDY